MPNAMWSLAAKTACSLARGRVVGRRYSRSRHQALPQAAGKQEIRRKISKKSPQVMSPTGLHDMNRYKTDNGQQKKARKEAE